MIEKTEATAEAPKERDNIIDINPIELDSEEDELI